MLGEFKSSLRAFLMLDARPRNGDLSPPAALLHGRGDTAGALVLGVQPGSLAERLGLRDRKSTL